MISLRRLSMEVHQWTQLYATGGRSFRMVNTSCCLLQKISDEDLEWIRKADEARKDKDKKQINKIRKYLFGRVNVIDRNMLGQKITDEDRRKFVRPGVASKAVMLRARDFDQGEEEEENKSKEAFIAVINDAKIEKRILRSQYVEFIYASLKKMPEFRLERDLDTYKAILDVFPKGRYTPTNIFQSGFGHYMKQQQAAIDIMEQMEYYGVIPDPEFEDLIIKIFSRRSHAWKKVGRMIYWMSKFRYANPFPLPDQPQMPTDPLELARLAIKRMTVDVQTKISVFNTSHIKDATDHTWIVSAQSPVQSDIIADLKPGNTLYVDGPHRTWVRWHAISYFLLIYEDPTREMVKPQLRHSIRHGEKRFDVYDIPLGIFGGKTKEQHVAKLRSLHEQEDGTILSYCATGTSSPDSLLSWVRILEQYNPHMKNLQVVFRLHTPTKELQPTPDGPEPPAPSTPLGSDSGGPRSPSEDHHRKDDIEAEYAEQVSKP